MRTIATTLHENLAHMETDIDYLAMAMQLKTNVFFFLYDMKLGIARCPKYVFPARRRGANAAAAQHQYDPCT